MRILAPVIVFAFMFTRSLFAGDPPRVAVYADEGAMEPYITKACDAATSAGMIVSRVTVVEIVAGALEECDTIVFPGGTGSGQAKSLGMEGSAAVRAFAAEGGGVIGVCAGGYLLTEGYSDDTSRLELVAAELWDLDHWARGEGYVEIQPVGQPEVAPIRIRFENAPVFAPGTKGLDLPPYVSLATFATDLTSEPTERESIVGHDAVIASLYGKGRVVIFGPHPELTPGLEPLFQRALRWTAGHGESAPSWSGVLGGQGVDQ